MKETDNSSPFPWKKLAVAALTMGISPEQFWNLCPKELLHLLQLEDAEQWSHITRDTLDMLTKKFPDTKDNVKNDV